jgi:hypothetical protein
MSGAVRAGRDPDMPMLPDMGFIIVPPAGTDAGLAVAVGFLFFACPGGMPGGSFFASPGGMIFLGISFTSYYFLCVALFEQVGVIGKHHVQSVGELGNDFFFLVVVFQGGLHVVPYAMNHLMQKHL